MKTIFYFIMAILFNSNDLFSQAILFNRHYEFATWDTGRSIIEWDGQHYCVIGWSNKLNNNEEYINGLVVKFNSFGDTLITKKFFPKDTLFSSIFNKNSYDYFLSSVIMSDSNILVVGSTQSFGATHIYDYDLCFIKLDKNLDTLWIKTFSPTNDTSFIPSQIIKTSDRGYLIGGYLFSFYSSDVRAFLCKIDSLGNLIWRTSYSNIYFTSTINYIVETSDHGFFCSGGQFNLNHKGDPLLFKVDSVGNFQWMHSIPSTPYTDLGYKIVRTSDGNYLWALSNYRGSLLNYSYRFIKLTENDVVLWDKQYCNFINGGSTGLLENYDGSFILEGRGGTSAVGGWQGTLLKIDSNGDSLWTRYFGTPNDLSTFWDMAACNDGGYIMCGETYCCNYTPGVGNTSSLWLVRTDSLGLLVTGFNNAPDFSGAKLSLPFPNPCKDYFYVNSFVPPNLTSINTTGKQGSFLLLFDVTGKQLKEIPVSTGLTQTKMELTNLTNGNYLLVLSINGYNVAHQKIVKAD